MKAVIGIQSIDLVNGVRSGLRNGSRCCQLSHPGSSVSLASPVLLRYIFQAPNLQVQLIQPPNCKQKFDPEPLLYSFFEKRILHFF